MSGLLGSLVIALSVISCQTLESTPPSTPPKAPNIVFILSDDHRWDQLGCAGHPILKTPNIDQLAQDGVRFENMFVTTSICAASRASIFTGMYERGHKYTFGTKPLARKWMAASYPSLLRDAGYRTGFVGKFGVQVSGRKDSLFDFFKPLSRNPYFKKQPDGSLRHATQITGDRAIEFLDLQDGSQPFCLSVSFNAPHAEDGDKQDHFPVPKAVAGLYDETDVPKARISSAEIVAQHPDFFLQGMHRERFHWRWDTEQKYEKNMRGYWGMISGVDHVVGRIRDKVVDKGLAANTIFIFTGDNGYYLGQRGFAGKWSHYEESLRVPLIIYDPRRSNLTSEVRTEMVLNVDLAPTILVAANVAVPEHYQGRSIVPLLHKQGRPAWRTEFFCEHLFHIPGRIPKYEGVRGQEWTYARYFEQAPPYEFLHNLTDDPDQLKNLAQDPEFSNQLTSMRKRCDQLVNRWGGPYSRKRFPLRNDPPTVEDDEPKSGNQTVSNTEIEKPNIVLIISDDQQWTDYSFMGHETIQTPSLDQLARESAVFPRGYVPTALCRPSLATIITGLYPHQHRITGNDPARSKSLSKTDYLGLRNELISHIDDVETIPKMLANAGYLSFQSGKWWEGHFSRGGFTHGMTHGDPQRGGRHGDQGLTIGRQGLQPIETFIDHSIASKKPFFVWYAPFLPHTPHNPPPRILDKYITPERPKSLAKYYAMCEWFDETCGQLLTLIDDKGLRDNTVIIYVTDNGWIQRTPNTKTPHGWSRSFAPRSKQSPNEGGVRTPIMVRWPGRVSSGVQPKLVSSIDIAPTILAACGIDKPKKMSGRNLVAVASEKTASNRSNTIFGEGYAHDIANIHDPLESLLYRWVIRDHLKLIRFYPGKTGRYGSVNVNAGSKDQLYDLNSDPHENRNLADSHKEAVQELGALLMNNMDFNNHQSDPR